MSHRLYSVLTFALLASSVGSASGSLIYYDSFGYASTGSLGTAGSPNWTKNGSSADPTVQNVGGLTYPGLLVSNDTNSLQYDGNSPAAATDGHAISAGITTGSVY